ncbi:MAG: uroporphyrinogen-III synthase [Candidatus Nezhaarchaeota archaeon]|nr:uroporphyrinogen-III synthase [Candidatus Nezhaarchaeota archaeon]MCX8141215.1 uroporphyrinogen-III synthase [Candidatus Nezhaarchaeota archaeon]MDW8049481.1 uroporphyrinogen-III synthase [Nitrososphaerota archaeon]
MQVLVVGTQETSSRFAEQLRRYGFNAEGYGVLEVKPKISEDLIRRIESSNFDILIFTSKNAVRLLLMFSSQQLKHVMRNCRIYAIGERTRRELEFYGFSEVIVPVEESSKGLLERLKRDGVEGKSIAIFHSTKVNRELIDGLEGLGARAHSYALYDITVDDEKLQELLKSMKRSSSVAIVFLARTAIEALIRSDVNVVHTLRRMFIVALGENVSKALKLHGIPHRIAQRPDVNSILAIIK